MTDGTSMRQPHQQLCIAVRDGDGGIDLYPVRGIFFEDKHANCYIATHPGTAAIGDDFSRRIYVCDIEPLEVR